MGEALDNIRVVLVNPKVPGNIGWSARAMKNMGLSQLVMVNPVEHRFEDVKLFAYGAEDVLKRARVFGSLTEALRDVHLTVGTTRRLGKKRRPSHLLRDAAEKIVATARDTTVALVFGCEDKGLTNDELSLCDMVVTIPEESDYPSLNLSHAVAIVCYELYLASRTEPQAPSLDLASREEIERMYEHLGRTLAGIGYERTGDRDLLKNIMTSFRRLFGRAGLERHDINAIRGLCRRIEKVSGLAPNERDERDEKSCSPRGPRADDLSSSPKV